MIRANSRRRLGLLTLLQIEKECLGQGKQVDAFYISVQVLTFL